MSGLTVTRDQKTDQETSYTQNLISIFPEKIQGVAQKVNQFLKKYSLGFSICSIFGPFKTFGFVPCLPYAIGGIVVGIALSKFNITPFNKLQSDDKAWIIIASLVVTAITNWPLCLACSIALIFLGVRSNSKVQHPKKVEDIFEKKVLDYAEIHKENPGALVERIKEYEIQLKTITDDKSFISLFNEFATRLEAYTRIVARDDNVCSKEEIFAFLYEDGTLPHLIRLLELKNLRGLYVPSYALKCHDLGGYVGLSNGSQTKNLSKTNNSHFNWNYNSFTLIYPSQQEEPEAKIQPNLWPLATNAILEVELVHQPYFSFKESAEGQEDFTLIIVNNTSDRLLNVEIKSQSFGKGEIVQTYGHVRPGESYSRSIIESGLVANTNSAMIYPVRLWVEEFKILGHE